MVKAVKVIDGQGCKGQSHAIKVIIKVKAIKATLSLFKAVWDKFKAIMAMVKVAIKAVKAIKAIQAIKAIKATKAIKAFKATKARIKAVKAIVKAV